MSRDRLQEMRDSVRKPNKLRQWKDSTMAAVDAILANVKKEHRPMSEVEKTQLNAHFATAEAIDELLKEPVRAANGDDGPDPIERPIPDRQLFIDFGSFLRDVYALYSPDSSRAERDAAEKRMQYRTASGFSQQVPGDGGFLVLPEFADRILERAYTDSEVLSRCTEWQLTQPGIKIPAIDESSRQDGSRFGGVRGYWLNEAGTATKSKAKFGNIELNPKKVAALAYLTSELLTDDAGVLGQFVFNAFAKELSFRITDGVINGDGAGKPQGIVGAPARITTPKVSQSSATIVGQNCVDMYDRLWVGSKARGSAAWFVHSDALSQVITATITVGSGGSELFLYHPTRDPQNQPFGTMLNCPVIPIEQCQALGTEGDIILADMAEYQLAVREWLRQNLSMHVSFTTDEQVFRLVTRVDGASGWLTSVTPFNGSNPQSAFVTLQAR